ncbi:MAG: hypothetical protein J6X56_06325 [Ruminococcus sp.]|nr:hypothetical protein [Ruminococcus sp.]
MKNTIKKAICTALAAVSLSAMVTVPSSLNAPKSENSVINVIEAEAMPGVPYSPTNTDYEFYLSREKASYIKHQLVFKLSGVNKLNGRDIPDGKIVHTFSDKKESILIDKIRIEYYTKDEHRIWGRTLNKYVCKDGTKKQVWICLYRAFPDSLGIFNDIRRQAECTDPYYGKSLTTQLIKAVKDPHLYLSGSPTWIKLDNNKASFQFSTPPRT